jgi:hypothetical protein
MVLNAFDTRKSTQKIKDEKQKIAIFCPFLSRFFARIYEGKNVICKRSGTESDHFSA